MNDLTSPTNLILNPLWGAAGLPGNIYTPIFHPQETTATVAVAPVKATSGAAGADGDVALVVWLAFVLPLLASALVAWILCRRL